MFFQTTISSTNFLERAKFLANYFQAAVMFPILFVRLFEAYEVWW